MARDIADSELNEIVIAWRSENQRILILLINILSNTLNLATSMPYGGGRQHCTCLLLRLKNTLHKSKPAKMPQENAGDEHR